MLDPKTTATILNAAKNLAADEEKRLNLFLILLTPFLVLLLIITFIVYILTTPFGEIIGFFLPNELSYVEEIVNDYSYEQLVGEEEGDLQEETNHSDYYSDITLEGNEVTVVYYNQLDERWKNLAYGKTGTIGRSGCGPTALAMVISTFTEHKVNPIDMCKWSYEHGYYCEGAGSYHSLISNGARHFGLKVKSVPKSQSSIVQKALSEGKLVIAIMGKGHFTRNGHFIVLRGITDKGKILVADPASYNRSGQEWDFSIIVNEAKNGAEGAFWIISK